MGLGNFRQNIMPYCMEYQTDGGWVFLNREYQPVGFNAQKNYNISRDDFVVYFKNMSLKKINKLSINEDWLKKFDEEDCTRIWFYNDGCIPDVSKKYRDQYLEKIVLLMSLDTYEVYEEHPRKILWLWLTPENRKKRDK